MTGTRRGLRRAGLLICGFLVATALAGVPWAPVRNTTAAAAPPVDKTAPTTSLPLSPASPDGSNGWYTSTVRVTFSATDNAGGSGVASTRCVLDPATAPVSFDAIPPGCPYGADVTLDGAHVVYAASVDAAGNKELPVSVGFKIDKTRPVITAGVASGTLGAHGWYTSDVVVHFTCTDGGSGIPDGACPADQTLTAEGAAVSSTAHTVSDAAGNTSLESNVVTVRIDKTAPVTTPGVVVKPVIGRPVAAPSKLVAGRMATVSFRVTRSDTGKALTSGTMTCDPRVGSKVIRHVEQFRYGTATLRFTVPETARGKLLKVHLTIRYEGQSATRVSSFHVT